MHNQGALRYLGPGMASPSCIACVVAFLVGVVFGSVIGIGIALQHRACQAACQHAGLHLSELAVHGFHHLQAYSVSCLQPGERKRSAFPRRGGEPAHQSAGDFPFGFRSLLGGFTARFQHPDAVFAYAHFKLVAARSFLGSRAKHRAQPHVSHAKIRTLQVRQHLPRVDAAALALRIHSRFVALRRRLSLVSCRRGIACCDAAAAGNRQGAGKEHNAFLHRGPVHVRRLPNGRGGM